MSLKTVLICAITSCLFINCSQQQQARKPVSQSSGTFMKESAERNKKLIAQEESAIAQLIKADTASHYIASSKGYWYAYENQNKKDTLKPKRGNVAIFDYEIKQLNGAVIYSKNELQTQNYLVDKQNIMMGLRDGIKLMHKNETVKFIFPSHIAFGYHGDNHKIGSNQPLICTVTLNDIK